MAWSIQDTLKSGNKVFMCGCGATGRLSLVLETLFRQKFGNTDKVISFMAGGDFALIKSVESFEDRTEYGERQLMELGFGLMIFFLLLPKEEKLPLSSALVIKQRGFLQGLLIFYTAIQMSF